MDFMECLLSTIEIIVLVENQALDSSLGAEHGLAFCLRWGSHQVLFDTGQTDLILANARQLGVDLTSTTDIVLSHGHYDHTGGLSSVGNLSPRAQVWGHPDLTAQRFSIRPTTGPRNIGIPEPSRQWLSQRSLNPTLQPAKIRTGLHATGQIPRLNDFEDVGGPFFLDREGHHPDPIADDQALWFLTPEGLVILLGCAHAGILNTIACCQRLSGCEKVHALIGGFHLVNADDSRLSRTIEGLKELDIPILAACHCTGAPAVDLLKTHFPNTFFPCPAGSRFTFSADA